MMFSAMGYAFAKDIRKIGPSILPSACSNLMMQPLHITIKIIVFG